MLSAEREARGETAAGGVMSTAGRGASLRAARMGVPGGGEGDGTARRPKVRALASDEAEGGVGAEAGAADASDPPRKRSDEGASVAANGKTTGVLYKCIMKTLYI